MLSPDNEAETSGRCIDAQLLIRDGCGSVLLILTPGEWGFILPGGGAEANESAHLAAARGVAEKTGASIKPGRLLAADYSPADPANDRAERYNLVFDGGRWPGNTEVTLPVPADPRTRPEVDAYAFVAPERLGAYARPCQVRRIRIALTALQGGRAAYLVAGDPV